MDVFSLIFSSGLGASLTELSTNDSEFNLEKTKKHSSDSKLKKLWNSEESGYLEGPDTNLDSSVTNLSPVHEIK